MRVLIVGLSSIAQRRVLPALEAMVEVQAIDIASRSKAAPASRAKPGRFYDDYAQAIDQSDADLLYISLPNSNHREWVLAGLEAGKHVIADKPATLTLAEARDCVAAARQRSLILAEATVFSYHPQFDAMRDFFARHGPLTHIDAQFIIPPMPLDNFRNYRRLGGGCLQDMGPYAAALARLFGGGPVTGLSAFPAPAADDRDIDMGFSLVAAFESGVRMTGHFSFESEYHNRLALIGKSGALATERAFSLPADLEPLWQVRRRNQPGEETLPASDAFRSFVEAVVEAIATGSHDRFLDDLLSDAAFRERLAAALGHGVDKE
jgi:NDP-hexose-3-ketoreductase